MKSLSENAIRLARVLIAIVFVLNAIGVIDQTIPAKEMMERGVPAAIVPWFMFAGRMLEFIAGVALVFGAFPRAAALALLAFLIPATLVSHSFWLSAGTPFVHGPADQFLEKPGDLWGAPIHRRKLEPTPGRNINYMEFWAGYKF
jgi:uncharacterized membrane protein YphA (DoxX/SURF4 family)